MTDCQSEISLLPATGQYILFTSMLLLSKLIEKFY